MAAYYNENDPKMAAWLTELIRAGLIAEGDVDVRSIELVRPSDLRGFTQCHFFAGIGGWSYALRRAGWPDDRPVWTGSCPCQPFSDAGKKNGADDPRHLWPTWFKLIAECRPDVVFGEQVASADGLGWFDRVSTDLEAADYAVGAADLCAAGVGAPHIRQRLWFVASMGDASDNGRLRGRISEHAGEQSEQGIQPDGSTSRGRRRRTHDESCDLNESYTCGQATAWEPTERWESPDGITRLTGYGLCPVADGIPNRVALFGYGNAIVPQVAAEFVRAYMDVVRSSP